MLATGEDYRYRGVKGPRPHWSVRLMHRYVDRVVALSTEQLAVRARLMRVVGLMAPARLLFAPTIGGAMLKHLVARSRARGRRLRRRSSEVRVSGAEASPTTR